MPLLPAALLFGLVLGVGGSSVASPASEPAASGPAASAPPSPRVRLETLQRTLKDTEAQKKELESTAAALDREILSLRQRLLDRAADVDASASKLDGIEASLKRAEEESARKTAAMGEKRAALALTLARLQTWARQPPALALFSPLSPLERVQASLQIKAILPALRQETASLAAMVAEVRTIRTALQAKRAAALKERTTLSTQQATLERLMRTRTLQLDATRRKGRAEEERARQLAAEASSLEDLVNRLAQEQAARRDTPATSAATSDPPLPRPAPAARGSAPLAAGAARRLPVIGAPLVRFGEQDGLGVLSKGITLSSRPGAPVTAIAPGRVAFAGPFRGYGRLLILEHERGYHSIVAGLAVVSVSVGQRVAAGEPLGLTGSDTSPPPQLYFEVRHGPTPIDPLGEEARALLTLTAKR